MAITESAIQGNIGAHVQYASNPDNWPPNFFGESQSRTILTCDPKNVTSALSVAASADVAAVQIGAVGGTEISINCVINLPLETAADVWLNAFENTVAGSPA